MQFFTKSTRYAIEALAAVLSRPAGDLTTATEIAAELGGSATYVNKVLQELVRAGVLGSRRGVGGGFFLERSPQDVSLWDVVAPFEDLDDHSCPIDGGTSCEGGKDCGMHGFWARTRASIEQELKQTSLQDFYRQRSKAG